MTTREIIAEQPLRDQRRAHAATDTKVTAIIANHNQTLLRDDVALRPAVLNRVQLAERAGGFKVFHHAIELQTEEGLQIIDLTDEVRALVAQSGVANGMVNAQTRHTTTAVIINENEPLLLEDIKRTLARLVPQDDDYQHNNFAIRTHNMTPDETPNGHSHCQALLLSSSATLNVIDGALQLGRWQRIFFIELDHARPRTVSITVMGQTVAPEFTWN